MLAYPSDALTFAALRRAHPDAFAQDDPAFFSARRFGDVAALVFMERALAHLAFAQAAGLPAPYPALAADRAEIVENLAEQYLAYGLASGPESTRQLIRGFEQAAALQAQAAGQKR